MREYSIPVVAVSIAMMGSVGVLVACGNGGTRSEETKAEAMDIRATTLANQIAYVSSQCFTKTVDDAGKVHNPCYACHIPSREPNYLDDGNMQSEYRFPGDPGATIINPWTNLFKDRSAAVAGITDDAVLAYVRQDNYLENGSLLLTELLSKALPASWDVNGNGKWDGYLPDAYFNFDDEGFDRAPDGRYTGWRAFAYAPFLGTFWPTNGSTDDALIRLAPGFRQAEDGTDDMVVYKTNLAILTAVIERRDVILPAPVNEAQWGVDLDHDGAVGTASLVKFDWAPLEGRLMSFVGRARLEQQAGRIHLAAGLFPEGTEFLHSVRYLNVDDSDTVGMAKRMKELRYAVKRTWYTYSDLKAAALKEVREKDVNPERTRQLTGNAEIGMGNGQGWTYQGFIEDKNGRLRPQNYEETAFCIGCHSGIGATTDNAFSFPRKFRESGRFQAGWYHWSQKGLAGTPEPVRSDGRYEYTYYLEQNGAGDEFRGNDEIKAKFFAADGSLKPDMIEKLHADVTVLLTPSRSRALALDKAYRAIVQEQSFVLGRDATTTPVTTVHQSVAEGTPTGVVKVVTGP
jgi:hypothetical protein